MSDILSRLDDLNRRIERQLIENAKLLGRDTLYDQDIVDKNGGVNPRIADLERENNIKQQQVA